jgi:hypothetical protein
MARKPQAKKPPAEKSEESSSASGGWQQAGELGINFGTYLQNEKQAAAKTPRGAPRAAATETKSEIVSYRRGRIWA